MTRRAARFCGCTSTSLVSLVKEVGACRDILRIFPTHSCCTEQEIEAFSEQEKTLAAKQLAQMKEEAHRDNSLQKHFSTSFNLPFGLGFSDPLKDGEFLLSRALVWVRVCCRSLVCANSMYLCRAAAHRALVAVQTPLNALLRTLLQLTFPFFPTVANDTHV